ncbi:hypothetical protein FQR65_LT19923 [Abscondita terminalis]|nr:hypothetical protein FQR65_LT19923 [Abscondita terminalis]
MEPTVEKDEFGEVVRAGIYTYGETVHMFVERKNYNGVFLPGYKVWESDYKPEPVGLKYIDQCVTNESKRSRVLSTPPQAYYDAIPERLKDHMSKFKEDINELQKLGIMIDADEKRLSVRQIFTKPLKSISPTVFFEIIQRMGARGFGAGNFKALFESIEREQEKRGTL